MIRVFCIKEALVLQDPRDLLTPQGSARPLRIEQIKQSETHLQQASAFAQRPEATCWKFLDQERRAAVILFALCQLMIKAIIAECQLSAAIALQS